MFPLYTVANDRCCVPQIRPQLKKGVGQYETIKCWRSSLAARLPLSKKPWKMISISHSFPILEKHCAKTFINGLHKKRIVFFGRNYKKW